MFTLNSSQRKELRKYANQFFDSHLKQPLKIRSHHVYDFKLKNDTLEKIGSINTCKMNDKELCELCKLISKYSIEEALSVLE